MNDPILVMLQGNAGKDAVLSVNPAYPEVDIVDLRVATDYFVRGVKHTQWTDVQFRGKLADRARHIEQGAKISVTGTLRNENRHIPNLGRRQVTFVLARKLDFLTSAMKPNLAKTA